MKKTQYGNKIAFQSNDSHPRTRHRDTFFLRHNYAGRTAYILYTRAVASLGLVSPGAATDGANLFS